jgi:DNA-binding CsgD family transcriptional regulator
LNDINLEIDKLKIPVNTIASIENVHKIQELKAQREQIVWRLIYSDKLGSILDQRIDKLVRYYKATNSYFDDSSIEDPIRDIVEKAVYSALVPDKKSPGFLIRKLPIQNHEAALINFLFGKNISVGEGNKKISRFDSYFNKEKKNHYLFNENLAILLDSKEELLSYEQLIEGLDEQEYRNQFSIGIEPKFSVNKDNYYYKYSFDLEKAEEEYQKARNKKLIEWKEWCERKKNKKSREKSIYLTKPFDESLDFSFWDENTQNYYIRYVILTELSEKQIEVLKLFYYEGKDIKEIVKLMNIDDSVVYRHKDNAEAKLKQIFMKDFEYIKQSMQDTELLYQLEKDMKKK